MQIKSMLWTVWDARMFFLLPESKLRLVGVNRGVEWGRPGEDTGSSYFRNAWLEISNFKAQYLCLHLCLVTT